MNPANTHQCKICYASDIPMWRAVCRKCFSLLPPATRADYSKAYRARIVEPEKWQDMHIHWRQWFLEKNAHDQRGEE